GMGEHCRGGIPGCVITGWHGSGETVKIPRTINGRPVVQIEKEAFAKKQIKEIYLPDSVIGISERAFAESTLTYARLSKALVYIGKEAFSECALLERVYMGNVRVIDERAFFECERLRQVRLPEEVWYIKDRAFAGSGLEKLYWNKIMHSDSYIIFYTPFDKRHELIVLGDTLQRCSTCAPNELIIDIPGVTAVGASAFQKAAAKKIILSENIRFIDDMAFADSVSDRIAEEIYAPGAWKFGGRCFDVPIGIKKITVSENHFYGTEKRYLYMNESAFYRTSMEERYLGGSRENPCTCAMVRNILARVDLLRSCSESGVSFEILTLSEDGGTLIMDDRVEHTAARHIPNLGAKKLIVSRNMRMLHSFASIEDFEEIVFGNPVIYTRDYLPFRPKKSVIVRYKFDIPTYGKPVDCAVLLYLPNVAANSPEAEKLYALYDRCIAISFSFDIYDREILTLVSSYRARFTIARMRLENDYGLSSEARERYENFLLTHKRKAEFNAKKHGDTALLSLLEKLSEKTPKNTDSKEGGHK
ncbi:MAG: leucine-rich repeat domain-containing protein, partial [Oscillospiraceae bacterium]|nr:leucine-rich repeat domain-containing protein [Oscillospiraceae bacterium]